MIWHAVRCAAESGRGVFRTRRLICRRLFLPKLFFQFDEVAGEFAAEAFGLSSAGWMKPIVEACKADGVCSRRVVHPCPGGFDKVGVVVTVAEKRHAGAGCMRMQLMLEPGLQAQAKPADAVSLTILGGQDIWSTTS